MVARAIDDGNDRTRPNGMEIERAVGSRTEMKFRSSRFRSPLHRARAPPNVAVAAVDRPTERDRTEPIAIDAAMPSSRSPPIILLIILLTIDRVFFPCIRHAYGFLVSPGHTGTHRDTHTHTNTRDRDWGVAIVLYAQYGFLVSTVRCPARARIRVASGRPPAPTATGVRDDRDTATTV